MEFHFVLPWILSGLLASSSGNQKPVVVPFVMKNNEIVISATINSKPVRLTLDTGSPYLYLRSDVPDRIGLRLPDSPSGMPLYDNIASLQIGGVTWRDVPYDSLPKEHMGELDGLLGVDLLQEYAVGCDLAKKRLTFWHRGKLTRAQVTSYLTGGKKASTIYTQELTIDDQNHLETIIQADDRKIVMRLDTGAFHTTFDKKTAEAFRPLRKGITHPINTLSGTTEVSRNLVRAIHLGQMTINYPVVLFFQEKERGKTYVNLLGMDILARTRFILDFSEPQTLSNPPQAQLGQIGESLATTGNRFLC